MRVSLKYHLNQRSPTFLAPETDFTEDNFSMERGGVGEREMVQAAMPVMGSDEEPQMKLACCSPLVVWPDS